MSETSESEDDDDGLPQPGEVLCGKYRVEYVLGRGGMGTVVAAKHLALGQSVAVKILSPADAARPEAAERFLREARAAAALRSDHVVRIYDVDTTESGAPFIVMELLRGMDFATLIAAHGAVPFDDAVDLVLQACHAIAEAHREGIVHRDIKPSNLFLTERSDGAALVKVLDFGIAKALDDSGSSATLTATRAVMGSPRYMSPEQVRSARRVDTRSDVWSLGAVLHELVTGRPAFDGETFPGICAAIAADPPDSILSSRPDAPVELERVVLRCLEKDPLLRYQTVEELARELRNFLGRNPAGASARSTGASSLLSAAREAERAPFSETKPPVRHATSGTGETLLSAGSDPNPRAGSDPTPKVGSDLKAGSDSDPKSVAGRTLESTTSGTAVSDAQPPRAKGRRLVPVLAAATVLIAVLVLVLRRDRSVDQEASTAPTIVQTAPPEPVETPTPVATPAEVRAEPETSAEARQDEAAAPSASSGEPAASPSSAPPAVTAAQRQSPARIRPKTVPTRPRREPEPEPSSRTEAPEIRLSR